MSLRERKVARIRDSAFYMSFVFGPQSCCNEKELVYIGAQHHKRVRGVTKGVWVLPRFGFLMSLFLGSGTRRVRLGGSLFVQDAHDLLDQKAVGGSECKKRSRKM